MQRHPRLPTPHTSHELVRGSERSCLRLSLGPAGALARSEVPFPDGPDAHQGRKYRAVRVMPKACALAACRARRPPVSWGFT